MLLRHALSDVHRHLDVIEAASHEEALACYRGHPADVVFLDIRLPGHRGLRTLKELLVLDPRVFVVMVSHFSTRAHVL